MLAEKGRTAKNDVRSARYLVWLLLRCDAVWLLARGLFMRRAGQAVRVGKEEREGAGRL